MPILTDRNCHARYQYCGYSVVILVLMLLAYSCAYTTIEAATAMIAVAIAPSIATALHSSPLRLLDGPSWIFCSSSGTDDYDYCCFGHSCPHCYQRAVLIRGLHSSQIPTPDPRLTDPKAQ